MDNARRVTSRIYRSSRSNRSDRDFGARRTRRDSELAFSRKYKYHLQPSRISDVLAGKRQGTRGNPRGDSSRKNRRRESAESRKSRDALLTVRRYNREAFTIDERERALRRELRYTSVCSCSENAIFTFPYKCKSSRALRSLSSTDFKSLFKCLQSRDVAYSEKL